MVAGLFSPFLTVEEAYLLARYLKGLSPANVLAMGPIPMRGTDQTFRPDQTKGRTGDTSFVVPRPFTIHAEKCPNRAGVAAVLDHFEGKVDPLRGADAAGAAAGEFQGLYVASDAIDPWIDEAAGRGPAVGRRVPGGAGHERHAAGASGRRRAGRARPSPRRPAATSTPTAGCSTPRRRCRPATARCPTSTCCDPAQPARRRPVESQRGPGRAGRDDARLRRRQGGQAARATAS